MEATLTRLLNYLMVSDTRFQTVFWMLALCCLIVGLNDEVPS